MTEQADAVVHAFESAVADLPLDPAEDSIEVVPDHAGDERLAFSAAVLHRVLRVARTLADLAGAERLSAAHVAEAIQYRAEVEGARW